MFRPLLALGLALALLSFTAPIQAQFTIVPTFDSTITSDPNSATIIAGINAVIARVEAAIANPITVNITYTEMTTGLGGSSTFIGTIPYGPAATAGSYLNALTTMQILSANDNSAIASLPNQANNPVNGNSSVFLPTSLLRALGFAVGSGTDGTVFLNTSIMNLSRSGMQNPSFYDLQAVAAHETNEVLGIGGTGSLLPTTSGAVGTLDLFRYSAPGVRSFTTSGTSYFSINGGTTNLVNFNQAGGGSDYSDWASSATPQVQDAFGTPGVDINIGANELTALDVIGYNLITAVPEPATIALISLAGMGTVGTWWHRRRQLQKLANQNL